MCFSFLRGDVNDACQLQNKEYNWWKIIKIFLSVIKYCILYITSVFVKSMGTVELFRQIMQNCKCYVKITILFVNFMGMVKL